MNQEQVPEVFRRKPGSSDSEVETRAKVTF